ncbi:hypothetical protein V5799_026070 [Amblyomma americanum]|uniref:Uncharacterized protein n=1 Tax=Amblyomma americanum TaxID=6943 RepID=A0AAQ4DJM2_AMBAM
MTFEAKISGTPSLLQVYIPRLDAFAAVSPSGAEKLLLHILRHFTAKPTCPTSSESICWLWWPPCLHC